MRTTIELDDDVVAAVEQLRREFRTGVSEAVNQLIRLGLLVRPSGAAFTQTTHRLAAKIDVSNVADALEVLEGPSSR